ncbi:hypothetical protein [Nocardia vulneris]|uniref:Uncharacterized protein n=1 Tax=Nocardia vulneris TaxID=1141657 RepID=A0ABR4ZCI4_9NOCA|nr:hypothetical protein [Nocardia vulneris]KIA63024.1 hypothetical protein FG87_21920 [Nocardia vulneris]
MTAKIMWSLHRLAEKLEVARTGTAKKIRHLAYLVDPSIGPRPFAAYWNLTPDGIVITKTDGIQVRPGDSEMPGCPLWFMQEDYERSWKGMPR